MSRLDKITKGFLSSRVLNPGLALLGTSCARIPPRCSWVVTKCLMPPDSYLEFSTRGSFQQWAYNILAHFQSFVKRVYPHLL